jgi:hypothetical protein
MTKPYPRVALSGETCEQLIRDLVLVLNESTPIAPSETLEFVKAVIDYVTAIDEIIGSSTDGSDDLIDALTDYRGLGMIPSDQ